MTSKRFSLLRSFSPWKVRQDVIHTIYVFRNVFTEPRQWYIIFCWIINSCHHFEKQWNKNRFEDLLINLSNIFTPSKLIKNQTSCREVITQSDDEVGRRCTAGPLSVSGSGFYHPSSYFQLSRALRPSPMVRPAISVSETFYFFPTKSFSKLVLNNNQINACALIWPSSLFLRKSRREG